MVQISQYEQTKDLVDGAHEIFGFHPGYRGLHADGRLYRASFAALPAARRYTRARHLQGETVPVSVRFSKGGGNPDAPFGATVGMATRFYLPDGDFTNLVMLSQLLFPARHPADLLEAIALARPDVPGGPLNTQALGPFLQRHPEVANVLRMRAAAKAPVSFAHSEFHARARSGSTSCSRSATTATRSTTPPRCGLPTGSGWSSGRCGCSRR